MREGLYAISESERLSCEAKLYSIIHWHLGKPSDSGRYLVTIENKNNVRIISESFYNVDDDSWSDVTSDETVVAHCNVEYVTPYQGKIKK